MKEAEHMANCHVRSHMAVTLTVFANSRSASTLRVGETAGLENVKVNMSGGDWLISTFHMCCFSRLIYSV